MGRDARKEVSRGHRIVCSTATPAPAAGRVSGPSGSNCVKSVVRRGRAWQADVHPETLVGVLLGMNLGEPVEPACRSVVGVRDQDLYPIPPGGYRAIDLLQQRFAPLEGAYHHGLRVCPAELPRLGDEVHLVEAQDGLRGTNPV